MNNEERKFPVTKVINIPEVRHTGTIKHIDVRPAVKKSTQEKFEYVDFHISVDDVTDIEDFELKYSCPTYLSLNSKFGRLLLLLGMTVEEGKEIPMSEITEHCVGKKVSYMTMNEITDTGKFARIVDGSLELVQENPQS